MFCEEMALLIAKDTKKKSFNNLVVDLIDLECQDK